MNRIAVAALLAACACKGSNERAPAAATGGSDAAVPPAPGTLAPVAQLRGLPLLARGTRRVAVRFHDEAHWYEPAPGALLARDEIGLAVAREIANLGGSLADVFLGTSPIVSGGEHHAHRSVRVGPPAQTIAIDGYLEEVATLADGIEVWRVEMHAQKQLAIVARDGTVTRPPPLPLLGQPIATASPVSAKLCERPAAVDLASNRDLAVALIHECDPAAPIRLAMVRAPGAALAVERIPSPVQLGHDIVAIAVGRDGALGFAATRDQQLVVGRIEVVPGGVAKVSSQAGPPLASTVVREVVVADDLAVWSVVGERLYRDLVEVPLETPRRERLAPVALALDAHLGVMVIGFDGRDTRWLFAERPIARMKLAIPPR